MKWKDKLIDHLSDQLLCDPYWKEIIERIENQQSVGLHLAIFTEPYLTLLCEGKKTIESRFSQSKVTPFDRVSEGDVILVKESGGYVKGLFIAGEVKFYTYLNENRLKEIEDNYGQWICSHYDTNFWDMRAKANFATLIEVKQFRQLSPFNIDKNDQLGWVTLKLGLANTLFS
jgi:ASC-1-like (ASCH) protein